MFTAGYMLCAVIVCRVQACEIYCLLLLCLCPYLCAHCFILPALFGLILSVKYFAILLWNVLYKYNMQSYMLADWWGSAAVKIPKWSHNMMFNYDAFVILSKFQLCVSWCLLKSSGTSSSAGYRTNLFIHYSASCMSWKMAAGNRSYTRFGFTGLIKKYWNNVCI